MANYTSKAYTASMTVTPAASAYSANDVMATAQTLTWLDRDGAPYPGGDLRIISTFFTVAETGLQASEAAYSLKLYNVTPPSAHADNDAWDVSAGDRAAYIGALAVGTPVDLGSTLAVEVDSLSKMITVASTGKTFCELVTAAGFTPTAKARTVTIHAIAE